MYPPARSCSKYISISKQCKLCLGRQIETLSNRLNLIIEKKISKREFAKRVGISENYVYTLTGKSKKSPRSLQCLQRSLQWSSDMMPSGYCTEIINSKRLPQERCTIIGCGTFCVLTSIKNDCSLTLFYYISQTPILHRL